MKQYYFLIGTMAEFIKLLPIMVEMENRRLDFKIISTGQNNIRGVDLFSSLKHDHVDYQINNQPQKQSAFSLLSWWLTSLIKGHSLFKRINSKNTVLIIHGDTISTLLGAILGKIFHFKVAHIEAGLRSFHLLNPFPEEIDRVLVSKLADFHFCQNDWSLGNLRNVKGQKINTKSNTLQESLAIALKKETPNPVRKGKYFILIFHRQENLLDSEKAKQIISEVVKASQEMKCLFVIHGNTKQFLLDQNLYDNLKKEPSIEMVERIPYFAFMQLLRHAEFLITDGGSNQEETFYLGLPTLILRQTTERTEGLNHNVRLSKGSLSTLRHFLKEYGQYRRQPQKQTYKPSHIIVDTLEKA